ncbi:unnamed protein product [Spirodela intermedia]|uniref:Uncharacterized protein n=1 Tax=Spirodela intermedia TaxID=51605 RepID=A0ABN7EBM1_SPIIN|nr:unnamed protein product [Spirodela intermedia]
MASGLDSQPTSKELNDGQTGRDIGWRWCPSFVGEWGEALLSSLEAQEYLDRHHAMSRAHHNHYASVPRRESDGQRPCYAWIHVSFVSNFRSIIRHNHDIIMALVTYHRCGTHLGY